VQWILATCNECIKNSVPSVHLCDVKIRSDHMDFANMITQTYVSNSSMPLVRGGDLDCSRSAGHITGRMTFQPTVAKTYRNISFHNKSAF